MLIAGERPGIRADDESRRALARPANGQAWDRYGDVSNIPLALIVHAQKFVGTEYEDELRKARPPQSRRSRQRRLRSDGDSVKDQIMLGASQFTQHDELEPFFSAPPSLSSTLRTTHTGGGGGDGSGKSRLGQILMQGRDELRARSEIRP
jgi:hypothetical protein